MGDVLLVVIHMLVILLVDFLRFLLGVSHHIEVGMSTRCRLVQVQIGLWHRRLNSSSASKRIQIMVRVVNDSLNFLVSLMALDVPESFTVWIEVSRALEELLLAEIHRADLIILQFGLAGGVNCVSAHSLVSHRVRVACYKVRRAIDWHLVLEGSFRRVVVFIRPHVGTEVPGPSRPHALARRALHPGTGHGLVELSRVA